MSHLKRVSAIGVADDKSERDRLVVQDSREQGPSGCRYTWEHDRHVGCCTAALATAVLETMRGHTGVWALNRFS